MSKVFNTKYLLVDSKDEILEENEVSLDLKDTKLRLEKEGKVGLRVIKLTYEVLK